MRRVAPDGLRAREMARGARQRRRVCSCAAKAVLTPPAQALQALLQSPGLHLGPCAHDGLSARLIERNGAFRFMFMSGFSTSATQIGEPDAGLISYGEMLDAGRRICAATRLPCIGDGDTGYGNALNCKRTVRGYAQAGFGGVLIEDQVHPKQCGHMKTRAVVPRGEAVARIRAAVDARDEGAGICIVARSDARSVVSLEEALWRVQAFADAVCSGIAIAWQHLIDDPVLSSYATGGRRGVCGRAAVEGRHACAVQGCAECAEDGQHAGGWLHAHVHVG